MNKEGFGSQNSMALVESATVDGKDMQAFKCLLTKQPLEGAVRSLVVHFVLGYPSIIEVRAQGSGVWIILRVSIPISTQAITQVDWKSKHIREKTKIENFTS